MKNERYVVQIDFYIHAKSDKKAVKLAVWICKKLRWVFDNQANVTGVWSLPFGVMVAEKIKDDRIKGVME